MSTINLSELLKGTEVVRNAAGEVIFQSIRNMEVAFLTCPPEFSFDARFANPMTSLRITNRQYGHLKLENRADLDVIVAPQAAFLTKYAAQNHALPKSAYVPSGRSVDYNDAGCVQGSVGGHLRGSGDEEIRFVPISIREMMLDEVGSTAGYSHLYRSVARLGEKTHSQTGQYIDRYYSQYDPTLQEFIAHFERPQHTIGVIIFIDGEVVAIDKFPSFTYTAQVWDLLVRDCYGSLAIESQIGGREHGKTFSDTLAGTTQESGESTQSFLLRVLQNMRNVRASESEARVRELLGLTFEMKADPNQGGEVYQSYVIQHEGYIGQMIASGGFYPLVSLIKRDRFDPTRIRKTLQTVETYRTAAEKSRLFQL